MPYLYGSLCHEVECGVELALWIAHLKPDNLGVGPCADKGLLPELAHPCVGPLYPAICAELT